ncbi:response regulator with -like aaa-type and dna-binding domains : Response regulator with CheY-like receiver, AAA-type ATPase, and DNA-binding domains OS=Singulisphaera acidiphila (strain ATCC BAA-1392 / DSM 18658 / VKM B-2454 / MOB10) GN=Sinac_1278 PE=4 SV=1: Response_reg: Sigma54_activat: HTH_8 [Gemmataceae bacterium]|nr:response regulator with -like aaa-type and dna-binding domains : Response regulator with CheY-like receiver, AAA-type ATPase, and DNA-binding domains OS=Singulisphaera acidiphila (strain ATCC BAA-1392 / DSM 18658 / VKM B-2454 / MOB10) GN=Sinac_1278 PE=4 SV=1: Response_reg: Sigma54_activat: HTH_8 [Gemmataceae bacterium]VTU01060.1 response regulator with -like aaa-type and dna-binding domains : Response regulator with CheY-like receiver, AAA-type ATPase, and DNA-binding domains OS=Singulisphaera 
MQEHSGPKVLAIDDDASVLRALRVVVERSGQAFFGAATGAEGARRFAEVRPDVVLCDILLPDGSGLDVLRHIRDASPATPIIVMTGQDSSDAAIRSNASGAFEYVPKPFSAAGIADAVARALRAAAAARDPRPPATPPPHPVDSVLIGRCPAMQDVYRAVGRVARQRVTVLVLGESGTGKELIARSIHQHSGRPPGTFVAVNCAAVPEALLESELFGHEKGAFTGADRKRIGKFEQATGGTIFLDEVGDMSPVTQAKVLRVLQDQAFERVGGSEVVRTDARVVAATNRDLVAMSAAGRFRSDLYYRLAGYTIHLPPLRDRGDDLDLLVPHFLEQFRRELGIEVEGLAPDAVERLRAHHWPGNLRELQGVLRQAVLEAPGAVVPADALRLPRSAAPRPGGPGDDAGLAAFVRDRLAAGTRDLYNEWLARSEPELIRLALAHFDGNLTRAADALGLNRMTLRKRVEQYHLRTTPAPAVPSPAISSPPATA